MLSTIDSAVAGKHRGGFAPSARCRKAFSYRESIRRSEPALERFAFGCATPFPRLLNKEAIARLTGALLQRNCDRQLPLRCIQLEGLQQLADNQHARQSALIGWAPIVRYDEPADLHQSMGRDQGGRQVTCCRAWRAWLR